MAVSASQWFDYEVEPVLQADGSWVGEAVSLQARRGVVPGLAGARPTVRIKADTMRLESRPEERPPPGWTERLLAWRIIFGQEAWLKAHNEWIRRYETSAQVRAFEWRVPGLEGRLRAGLTLRLLFEIHGGPSTATRHACEVWVDDGRGGPEKLTPQSPVYHDW